MRGLLAVSGKQQRDKQIRSEKGYQIVAKGG